MRKTLAASLSLLIGAGTLLTGIGPATAASTVLINDTFTRTVTSGLGSAPTGGAYQESGSVYSVNGNEARITVAPGWTRSASTNVSGQDVDAKVTLGASTWPAAGLLRTGIRTRMQTNGRHYLSRLKLNADKTAVLNILQEGGTTPSRPLTPEIQIASGLTTSSRVNVRTQVFGTNTVTIKAKAWVVGTSEPADWQAVTQDSTTEKLGTSGKLGLFYYSSSASGSNMVVTADDFYVQTYEQTGASANFTADTTTDRNVTFSAAGSTPGDNAIASYGWDFGDGTTAAGISSNHVYTTTGNKNVTLTIIDNEGVTTTKTQTVNVTDTHAPTTPENLNVALNQNSTVLTWNPSSDGTYGSGLTNYVVYRDGTQIGAPTSAAYTDTTNLIGNFNYTIKAKDASGNLSDVSSTVNVVRRVDPPNVTNLATSNVTNNSVKLTWQVVGDIDNIHVTKNTAPIPSSPLAKTVTEQTETGLAAKTEYVYGVKTSNVSTATGGASLTKTSNENTITVTTNPNAPSAAVLIGNAPNANTATLSWTAATDATSYKLFKNNIEIANLPSSQTTFTDLNLTSKTTNNYKIQALNITGTSTSNTVAVTTPNIAPVAGFTTTPDDLAITFDSTNSNDPDGTIVSYLWDFGDANTSTQANPTHLYTAVGNKSVNLTVTDNDGAVNTISQQITVADTTAAAIVAKPTVNVNAGGQTATVTWVGTTDGNGTGVKHYKVYDGVTEIATVTDTTFTTGTLTPGTHTFSVKAVDNANNTSGSSATTTVTVEDLPQPATGLTATTTKNTATVTWALPSGTYSGFNIYGGPAGQSLTKLNTAVLTAPTYLASGLTANTNYDFRVDTLNSRGVAESSLVNVKTKRNAPNAASVSASETTDTSTRLTWTTTTDTDTYQIFKNNEQIGEVNKDVTTYLVTNLTPSTPYVFVVKAVGDETTSSTDVNVTTLATNVAPVSSFVYTNDDFVLTADGTASSDVDGNISTYEWNFGDGTTTTGAVVTKTYTAGGTYNVSLKVSDNRGSTHTATQTVTIVDPEYINDNFNRTETNTLGTAFPKGGTYFDGNNDSAYTVNGSEARITPGLHTRLLRSNTQALDVDASVTLGAPTWPTGTLYSGLRLREQAATSGGFYQARVKFLTDKTATLNITNATGTFATASNLTADTVFATNLNTNSRVRVRAQVVGTNPVVIRAKAWVVGTAEPTNWTATYTDSRDVSAGRVATAGNIGPIFYSSAAFVGAVDDLTAVRYKNEAPKAIASVNADDLKVTLNAGSSTDSNGPLTNYVWTFEDGSTKTGSVVEHTYTTVGSKSVNLTVTDNDGMSSSVTKTFNVEDINAPAAPVLTSLLDGSAEKAVLNWTTSTDGNGTGVKHYKVYDDVTEIATVTDTTFTTGTLTPGTHTFSVKAVDNANNTSGSSNGSNVAVEDAPAAVTNVLASPLSSSTVGLSWTVPATSIQGIRVYAGTSAQALSLMADNLAKTSTYYPVTGLAANTSYVFRVDTFNSRGVAVSQTVNAATLRLAPSTPVATATNITTTTATLNWAATTNTDNYTITNTTTGQTIATVTTPGYNLTGLTHNTTQTYTITANGNGTATSTPITITTIKQNSAPVASYTHTVNDLTINVTSTSTDTDNDVLSYVWNFGDGTATKTGATNTHTYVTAGTYTVTLTATDDDNATHSTTKTITAVAPNVAPTAAFTYDTNELTATLNASGSTDSDGTIQTYIWSFDDGGFPETGQTATHTYLTAGTYTVTLTVTDNDGATDTQTHNVSVTTTNTNLVEDNFNRTVTSGWGAASSAGGTYLNTGDKHSVSNAEGLMNFSTTGALMSRSPATGTDVDVTATFGVPTWPTSGTVYGGIRLRDQLNTTKAAYIARVKLLTNGNGELILAKNTAEFTGATIGTNTTFATGLTTSSRFKVRTQVTGTNPVTLKAKAWLVGTTEPANWQTEYTDTAATKITTSGNIGVYFDPTAAGYVIATDDLTAKNYEEENIAPTATFTKTVNNLTVNTTSTSTDTDGTVAIQSWNFGDGTIKTGPTATHTYTTAGTYNVTLTVTDDDDTTTTSAAQTVTVAPPNTNPIAAYTYAADELTVSLNAGTSTDADGDTLSYVWDLGNGIILTGVNASYTFTTAGTHTGTLTVLDGKGGTHVIPLTLTVDGYIVNDNFDRAAVSNGWGTAAPKAGTYLENGSSYSTNGTEGLLNTGTGVIVRSAVTATDIDVTATFGTPTKGSGTLYGGMRVRDQATTGAAYITRLKLSTNGDGEITFARHSATYVGANLSGTPNVKFATGLTTSSRFKVRTQVTGTNPVTLKAKAWLVGTTEPAAWTIQHTDNESAKITTAGHIGAFFTTGGTSHVVSIDDLTAIAPSAINTLPTAPELTAGAATISKIPLTWTTSINATGYTVYVNNQNVTTLPNTATSYTLTGLTPDTLHVVRVEALGDQNVTSNTVERTTAVFTQPDPGFRFKVLNTSAPWQVQFDASQTTGSVETYSWDYDAKGTTYTADATGAVPGVKTFNTNGTYIVKLTTRTENGQNYAVFRRVVLPYAAGNGTAATPRNAAASLLADFSSSVNGMTATFDGEASTGSINTYAWTVKTTAGTTVNTGTGKRYTYTFASSGMYNITLVVTDTLNGNKTSTATRLIHAYPAPSTLSGVTTPNDTNTGVPVGTTLTKITTANANSQSGMRNSGGYIELTTAGKTYSGYDFDGFVKIAAANITLTNSRINGRAFTDAEENSTNGYFLLHAETGNATLSNLTLKQAFVSERVEGLRAKSATATKLNISRVTDAIGVVSSSGTIDVNVNQSYIHNLIYGELSIGRLSYNTVDVSHSDGIQVHYGSGGTTTFTQNTITGGSNAAMMVNSNGGSIVTKDIKFENNYATGGAYTLNYADTYVQTGFTIKNNVFGGSTRLATTTTANTILAAWGSAPNANLNTDATTAASGNTTTVTGKTVVINTSAKQLKLS